MNGGWMALAAPVIAGKPAPTGGPPLAYQLWERACPAITGKAGAIHRIAEQPRSHANCVFASDKDTQHG